MEEINSSSGNFKNNSLITYPEMMLMILVVYGTHLCNLPNLHHSNPLPHFVLQHNYFHHHFQYHHNVVFLQVCILAKMGKHI